ncbi:MAG: EamA family transporter [Anaerolineales bacterium]|nr:EamA family transporter [Anaerolineales bacterium]MCB8991089.1 EamA family transporter [Ardenticatenaceae bacterium]MCB9004131.1 EamA family transporter [Ardenticatenaceae bacterium]
MAENSNKLQQRLAWGPTGRSRGLMLAVLASACWGTSGLFINGILRPQAISTWSLAFWREVFTFLTLLVGVGWKRPSLLRVSWRDLPWLAGMGISMGGLHVTWNVSIMTNGVAVATVMQYNAPILVALVGWLLWREPLTWRKLGAMVLAITGTALIARIGTAAAQGLTLPGLLVGLGTAVTYGSFTLFGKKLANSYSQWTIVLYVFAFAMLSLLPLQFGRPLPWPVAGSSLAAFAALVWLTTIVGYAFYTSSLQTLQASEAVIVSVTEVLFAAVLAFIVLGQVVDRWQIVGAILVISSVVLISQPRSRPN